MGIEQKTRYELKHLSADLILASTGITNLFAGVYKGASDGTGNFDQIEASSFINYVPFMLVAGAGSEISEHLKSNNREKNFLKKVGKTSGYGGGVFLWGYLCGYIGSKLF